MAAVGTITSTVKINLELTTENRNATYHSGVLAVGTVMWWVVDTTAVFEVYRAFMSSVVWRAIHFEYDSLARFCESKSHTVVLARVCIPPCGPKHVDQRSIFYTQPVVMSTEAFWKICNALIIGAKMTLDSKTIPGFFGVFLLWRRDFPPRWIGEASLGRLWRHEGREVAKNDRRKPQSTRGKFGLNIRVCRSDSYSSRQKFLTQSAPRARAIGASPSSKPIAVRVEDKASKWWRGRSGHGTRQTKWNWFRRHLCSTWLTLEGDEWEVLRGCVCLFACGEPEWWLKASLFSHNYQSVGQMSWLSCIIFWSSESRVEVRYMCSVLCASGLMWQCAFFVAFAPLSRQRFKNTFRARPKEHSSL